jgi:hypothetical protein
MEGNPQIDRYPEVPLDYVTVQLRFGLTHSTQKKRELQVSTLLETEDSSLSPSQRCKSSVSCVRA